MLPPGLVDLTLARTASHAVNFHLRRRFSVVRTLRNVEAIATSPTPVMVRHREGRGRRRPMIGNIALREPEPPSGSLAELDKRINALEALAEEDASITREELFYSEQDLASFYQDVLANPFEDQTELQTNEKAMRVARDAEDSLLVHAVYERFDVEGTSSGSGVDSGASKRPTQVILSRLDSIVSKLEASQRVLDASEEQQQFPVSILTMRECEALVRVSLRSQDAQSAELTLKLMKRTGLPLPEAALTNVLQLYAKLGDKASADFFVTSLLSGPPTEDQRHFHIQAHLKSTPPTLIPISALDLLHTYENQSLPAPMGAYTSIISSLFHVPSSIARGQAWDLFSHMRYVAHPDPDVPLYTTMIRACAYPLKSSLSSEPEKALDLWTEMTVDHGLTPTVASYNAVILACARDGTKEFVSEAFRIARQMLDSHRDAQGQSAYRPDRNTFCALLEGAKRIGDLSRVRWILAEMTRSREEMDDINSPTNAEVDEEIMMHVFNAYAAYKPPFIRAKTVVLDTPISKARNEPPKTTTTAIATEDTSTGDLIPEDEAPPTFAHIPPQTHNEVLQEVKFLFQSIRDAQNPAASPESDLSLVNNKFRNVRFTPRLITAYLSVFYSHSPLHISRDLFWGLFEELGVQRTARAYIEALERCANARKTRDGGHEREIALKFSEELCKDWAVIEASGFHLDGKTKLDARTIERANAAMVRVFTLTNQVDMALDVVRAFAERYPPQTVRHPPPKPLLRSTKTVLGGPGTKRPLVRMTAPMEVADDYVPPMLMFKDLEALHHRLVAYRRVKDIGYLKWLSKAYEWALRVRRDESTKFIPKEGDTRSKVPVVM